MLPFLLKGHPAYPIFQAMNLSTKPKSLPKPLWAALFFTVLLCMGCPMEIEVQCNGKTVGAVVEITFKKEERKKVETTNVFGQSAVIEMSGAHMEVGVKPKAGERLQDCCPGGQLVWRQWTRSSKGYMSTNTNEWKDKDTWYPDIANGSRNLPTYPPTPEQAKNGFTERFVDRPARAVSSAKDGDIKWEAVTAFGCLKNGVFTPLAAFKWGFEMDSDGDVDLDGPSQVSLSDLKDMNMP